MIEFLIAFLTLLIKFRFFQLINCCIWTQLWQLFYDIIFANLYHHFWFNNFFLFIKINFLTSNANILELKVVKTQSMIVKLCSKLQSNLEIFLKFLRFLYIFYYYYYSFIMSFLIFFFLYIKSNKSKLSIIVILIKLLYT